MKLRFHIQNVQKSSQEGHGLQPQKGSRRPQIVRRVRFFGRFFDTPREKTST
jgi:hypothetical protein